jgi:hypothetical protein
MTREWRIESADLGIHENVLKSAVILRTLQDPLPFSANGLFSGCDHFKQPSIGHITLVMAFIQAITIPAPVHAEVTVDPQTAVENGSGSAPRTCGNEDVFKAQA